MNPISLAVFIVFFAAAAVSFAVAHAIPLAVVFVLLAFVFAYSIQIAKQWQKAVVLRLGRLQAIRGPGLFLIIPVIDTIAAWIDHRIQTTEVNAEEALTKDTVPVNVDAIVFWQVQDTAKAALEVTDYRQAIHRVSQTTLREMIGASVLSELLSDRRAADARLKADIAAKIGEWGIAVNSVEIRDVAIPAALQEAMSRQAQAERERQARVILGTAEEEIAQKFLNAAKLYENNPVALQLRAMNIIYETTKERGATILLPTSLVDFMNPKPTKPG
ncbi:MAG TPA: slipin family protein [Magnetospirillaceae bacterium]|jgi:regulator of protease activity HflC (stomatin/prohibitin superfamily)